MLPFRRCHLQFHSDILDTLNNTIDPILDQICRSVFFIWFLLIFLIASAISSNSANDTSIAPLIHDLDTALYNASSTICALGYVNETADDIVRMAAPIINVCTLAPDSLHCWQSSQDIVKVVDPLRTQVSRAMLRKVDAALAHFMNSLEGHVAGLLDLVSARYVISKC